MTSDAIELADRVAAQVGPDVARRVQAALLLWALGSAPACVRDAAPGGVWDAATRAVGAVSQGAPADAAPLDAFAGWLDAHSTDWATREALSEIRYALDRVLGSPREVALGDTAHEIVRAAGLWLWDELLSEASADCGVSDGRQHAQEVVRDAAVEEAHRALSEILRRPLGLPKPEDRKE